MQNLLLVFVVVLSFFASILCTKNLQVKYSKL